MIRNAFKMKLKPSCVDEYKKRHDEIWPELAKAHSDAGIFDYSIYFYEESLTLFAFQKLTDDNTAAGLKDLEIVKKWWDYMADLMETHPNNMPTFKPLAEVFHMD
ncbi:MAG: L-rhamnose mutarotase [Kiritimatiellales bacterium]|nr:L-rhamnose mutarotase [Kiritimatiellales bacterium]